MSSMSTILPCNCESLKKSVGEFDFDDTWNASTRF